MKTIYLTPDEIQSIDPTGKATDHYNEYKRTVINRPSGYTRMSEDVIRRFVGRSKNYGPKHSSYAKMNEEALLKVGPQGGHLAYEELEAKLAPYYENAQSSSFKDVEIFTLGRDYLLRVIRNLIERNGRPQYIMGFGDATCAGLPTMGKKGTYQAETVGMKQYRHPMPAVIGQRYMRRSWRIIFMDATTNVRAIQGTLDGVRQWLKSNLPDWFSKWLPPAHMRRLITHFVDRNACFLETDYEKMDTHFTWEIVCKYILPVYELLSPDTYISFASFVEELFTQPIYMGYGKLITGKHSLLSGQGITNDFETLITVMWLLGICLKYGLLDNALLLAMGDDAGLGVKRASTRIMSKLAAEIIEASNELGLKMHPLDSPKTAIREGEVAFCRELFYKQGRRDIDGVLRGAYPTALVLNNILQPEKAPASRSIAAISDLQRMDNAAGSIDFYDLVQLVNRYTTHDWAIDRRDIDYVTSRDWWYKVYGEKWDPDSSPSARLLFTLLSGS